jgi:hypothetical protein
MRRRIARYFFTTNFFFSKSQTTGGA